MIKFALKRLIMMKRILLCLIGFMMLQAVPAKRMRDYFADMPDSILYVMTRNNRLDCIDFIENNMQARVRNRFDAFSELKTMTDDYLDLKLTASCEVEMKLFPIKDSLNYICMVKTVEGLEKESSVTLYTSEWKEVARSKWIDMPRYIDFWVVGDSVMADSIPDLQHQQDLHLISATLSPDDYSLTFNLSPVAVDEEVSKRIKPLLRDIVYTWNGKRFERVK